MQDLENKLNIGIVSNKFLIDSRSPKETRSDFSIRMEAFFNLTKNDFGIRMNKREKKKLSFTTLVLAVQMHLSPNRWINK